MLCPTTVLILGKSVYVGSDAGALNWGMARTATGQQESCGNFIEWFAVKKESRRTPFNIPMVRSLQRLADLTPLAAHSTHTTAHGLANQPTSGHLALHYALLL